MINLTNYDGQDKNTIVNVIDYIYQKELEEKVKPRAAELRAMYQIEMEEKKRMPKWFPDFVVFKAELDKTLNVKESYKTFRHGLDWEKPQKKLPEVEKMGYLTEKLKKFNLGSNYLVSDVPEYQEFEVVYEKADSEPDYLLEKRKDSGFENTAIIKRPKKGLFTRLFGKRKKKDLTEKVYELSKRKNETDFSPVDFGNCDISGIMKEDHLAAERKAIVPENVLRMLDESLGFC